MADVLLPVLQAALQLCLALIVQELRCRPSHTSKTQVLLWGPPEAKCVRLQLLSRQVGELKSFPNQHHNKPPEPGNPLPLPLPK